MPNQRIRQYPLVVINSLELAESLANMPLKREFLSYASSSLCLADCLHFYRYTQVKGVHVNIGHRL